MIDKWEHYFPIYQHHFSRFDGPITLLEIGVSHGGSLQLWKEYFHPDSQIVGIDIDPRCKDYEEDRISIRIMDQNDPLALSKLAETYDGFDIVIDDGSHVPEHQTTSFNALWLFTDGVYLIEDCHQEYPKISAPGALAYAYPWVFVVERPQRVIWGEPSRELRDDEMQAMNLYGA